jgi:TonB family protein
MAQTNAFAMVPSWQQWDGRIVNGRFPLRQYLGGSEHSVVYLTEIEGARAAIKLIPANSPRAQAQVASWKIAGQLSHPNLVRIFECGLWHADEQQDMQFAVIEYCEESLAGVLRQRPLTLAEVREMPFPALDALEYLHAQGIAHGQIKPANILAVGDQLKLSTDGLRRNGDADDSRVAGPYDPPEKTTGTISLNGDIWSLGITLVEALTKRSPLRDQDGNPELPEKLPPPFDAIVKRCLTPDPERRLSITAIRNLLDLPVTEAVAETKAVAKSEETSSSAAGRTAPAYVPAPPTADSSSVDRSAKGSVLAGKRPFVLVATALILVLAIWLGLRLVRNSSEPSQSNATSVAQPDGATATAPATTSVDAGASKPRESTTGRGAVLHEVMPDVSSQARNTINGTVKVKVRVAVDPQGKVSQAKLSEHGPSKYFADQALRAARQWTFVAPVRDEKPEASEWTLAFEFRRSGTRASAHLKSPA